MLTTADLSASYEGSRILRGVSLRVPDNQVVCLMGRNGVGKSTTLKAIMGLLHLEQGSVRFQDREIKALRPEQRARLGLGYVPQGRDIFPNLTVWENLRLSLALSGQKANGQLDYVFGLFPVLKEMLRRKGGVLSGGQQQQLAIARALLTEPKVLLLDEPTEGIQPNIIDLIGETILKIKAGGKVSVLLVEQYLEFCQTVGDAFYIMDRGAIVAQGMISELHDSMVRQHLQV